MNSIKLMLPVSIISVLLFTACNKENHSTVQNTGGTPAADLKLARMIEAFKAKGASQLKSSEEMCVDSAIWYLNVTANYTYGSASHETEKTSKGKAIIYLPVSNGKVSLSTVYSKYEEMIDSIRKYYRDIPSSKKQLISVRVETDTVLQDAIVLAVTSTVGTGMINQMCEFNDVDSWIWWNISAGGICAGPNYGQGNGSDAAEQIQNKIMLCKAVPFGNYWYEMLPTHQVLLWYYPNPNWDGTPNYYQYLMFYNYSEYPNFHGCLSPEECNFYLSNAKWIIYTAESAGGERPDEASFVSVDIQGDAILNNYTSTYLHSMEISYGILHVSPNPPVEID